MLVLIFIIPNDAWKGFNRLHVGLEEIAFNSCWNDILASIAVETTVFVHVEERGRSLCKSVLVEICERSLSPFARLLAINSFRCRMRSRILSEVIVNRRHFYHDLAMACETIKDHFHRCIWIVLWYTSIVVISHRASVVQTDFLTCFRDWRWILKENYEPSFIYSSKNAKKQKATDVRFACL